MAKFLLDTDSVLNVSKGMDTLTGNVDTVLSNVKSYDVSNDDFDFSGAKKSIVNNIEGIETKVSNTNVLLDTVVQVHSELQDSISTINDDGNSNSASTTSTSSAGVSSDGVPSSSYSSGDYYVESNTDSGNYGMGGIPDEYSGYYVAAPVAEKKIEKALSVEEVNTLIDEKVEEKTDAEVSKEFVSSIIDEKYKQVLEETKFEESTVTDLLNTIKSGEMCIVVEGNSLDLKTIEYLSVVAKAAMSVSAIMRFVKLDNILDFKTNNTASDMSESTRNVLSEDEEDKKTDEKTDNKVDEKVEEKKETETKIEALNYSVKDKSLLDGLSSIKCAQGIEISYEKLPITLIIKNNVVLSFKTGIISEDELRKELLRINVIPTIKT